MLQLLQIEVRDEPFGTIWGFLMELGRREVLDFRVRFTFGGHVFKSYGVRNIPDQTRISWRASAQARLQ